MWINLWAHYWSHSNGLCYQRATPFTICQASSWLMLLSTVFASFSGDDCVTCMYFVPEPIFYMCNCIKVFSLSLYSFSLCQNSSLGIVTLSSNVVCSLIISTNISSPFKPCMNCTLRCLSTSIYLHSTAAVLSLPIHSSTLFHLNGGPICEIATILLLH